MHVVVTVQDGKRVFSEIKTFIKRQPNKNTTYLTLTTESGNHVTLSGNHLVFSSSSNTSSDMEARYTFVYSKALDSIVQLLLQHLLLLLRVSLLLLQLLSQLLLKVLLFVLLFVLHLILLCFRWCYLLILL